VSNKQYQIIPTIRREALLALLKKGERLDGRGPEDIREIRVVTDYVGKAEGSALVHLGDTKVIAGVKAEVGKPFPDTPDMGVQIVNAELIPIASPTFEAGPPGEEDVELSRVVDRGLRSSGIIGLDQLALVPGEKVWTIFIDIFTLDHYGNLIDAAGLAATAAVLTTKIRRARVEDGEVVLEDERVPLPIGGVPVFVTVVKIADTLVVDPSYEEELVMDARLTFIVDEEGNICGMQKGGIGGFTVEEVLRARDMALEAADKVRKHLPPKPS